VADLTVIGGGPGGYVAAIRAAQLGCNVRLIEGEKVGGTCLNRGCIPTKVLLHATELKSNFDRARDYGFSTKEASLDWKVLMDRKDATVKQLTDGVATLLESWGVEVIYGEASFVNSKEIVVRDGNGTSKLRSDSFIIATGSKPSKPPIEGLNSKGILTSDDALSIEEIPSSMLIVGGGVIGIEFATLFSGLGCHVTVVEFLPRILSNIDEEMASYVHEVLSSKGVNIYVASRVTKIDDNKGNYLAVTLQEEDGKNITVETEKVLLAAGRVPNTQALNLSSAGVETERGRIKVDKFMRTNVPNIYAVGDCASPYMLAHVAMAEGEIAAENVADKMREMDYSVVPSCIFTSPELASVGRSELDCQKAGIPVKVGRFPMVGNGRALTLGEAEGMVKIIADSRYERVLGVHILGPNATELISAACMAMKLEATAEEISSLIFAHPTVGEALKEAASAVRGAAIHFPKV